LNAVKRTRPIIDAGWRRLAVPALVLTSLGFCGWHFMLWMPLESYRGPWCPLSLEENALRDTLQRDVRVIADEIGDRNVFVYPRLAQAAA
jgi:hypothetical protein